MIYNIIVKKDPGGFMFKDFFYDCFHINLKDYENIGFDLEICKVILVGFIALSVGIVILNVYRKSNKTN